ncbi:DoxX family membrane protein [Brevundimonas sp. DC300-4]|uniref:DoxX family membrane protein n=1 Tax=unclassified Brevundimonas TaxID=2622653 RepID=UPI003CF88305
MNFFNGASRWQPEGLAILRIVTGLTFLAHGVIKLFGFPPSTVVTRPSCSASSSSTSSPRAPAPGAWTA